MVAVAGLGVILSVAINPPRISVLHGCHYHLFVAYPCRVYRNPANASSFEDGQEIFRNRRVNMHRALGEGGEDPEAGGFPHLPSHVHNFADSEQRGSEGGTGAPTSCEQSHYAGSLRSGGYAEQEAGTKQTCSDGAQQGRGTGLTGTNGTMTHFAI